MAVLLLAVLAREARGAYAADVDRMVGDLDALEVRTCVERVLGLREVRVPDARVRLASRLRGGVAREAVRVVERDVRIQAAVRLVVDKVDLALVAGHHPREDGGVAGLLGQV